MFKWHPGKNSKLNPKVIDSFNWYASIALLALIAGVSTSLFWRLAASRMDFFNNLWAPAYLLVHGQNPYDTSSLHPSLPALWFPMAVGFFSPFGLLSEVIATKAWFVITMVELFAIVLLTVHDRLKVHVAAMVGFLVFLFPPLLNHIALGQYAITGMLCLLFSAYFASTRRDWLAAFTLALGLAKPQLGILALPGLSLYYFQRGGVKMLSCFGVKTFWMAILMSLPLFIAYPAWIPAWMESLQSNYSWLHPSLFSTLKYALGAWGYFLWGIIVLAGLVICYQLWKKLPPLAAMVWSLGLTTIITPYLWSWDFVLLIPGWVFMFSRLDWKGKILLIGAYGAGWLGFAFIQRLPDSSNDMFWWFPLWFMFTITLASLWRIRHRNFATPDDAPNTHS